MIEGKLKEAGFALIEGGPRLLWAPDIEALRECTTFGGEFAGKG